MGTTLVLIRHGQTTHNSLGLYAGWTDSELTEKGWAQAECMARYVTGIHRIDALYSSTLQRARRTAEAIGRAAGLDATLVDDLKEFNFGELEGLSAEAFRKRHPEVWVAAQDPYNLDFAYPGGESRRIFLERVHLTFQKIITGRPDQTVAVVAHGGVLGAYVAEVDTGQAFLWRDYVIDNCAICTVHTDGIQATLSCFNDTSHLDGHGLETLSVGSLVRPQRAASRARIVLHQPRNGKSLLAPSFQEPS